MEHSKKETAVKPTVIIKISNLDELQKNIEKALNLLKELKETLQQIETYTLNFDVVLKI